MRVFEIDDPSYSK